MNNLVNLEMLWLWIATMLIESLLKDSFLTLILSKWKALTTLLTIIPSKPLTVSLRLGTNPKEGLSLLILQIFWFPFLFSFTTLSDLILHWTILLRLKWLVLSTVIRLDKSFFDYLRLIQISSFNFLLVISFEIYLGC